MVDALIRSLKLASRTMVRHQILLSAGLSAAAGIILRSLVVIPVGNPLFQYMAVERPDLYRAFVWSFNIFLFTTPDPSVWLSLGLYQPNTGRYPRQIPTRRSGTS